MNSWAEHLNNPFAFTGFIVLLLMSLVLKVVKSKKKLDTKRVKLLITASYAVTLLGIGVLVVALFSDKPSIPEKPEKAVAGNVRTNSPSFGNVGGNVKIDYGEQVNED